MRGKEGEGLGCDYRRTVITVLLCWRSLQGKESGWAMREGGKGGGQHKEVPQSDRRGPAGL